MLKSDDNNDEVLYHFLWDQGRHGKLEGWFLARRLDVEDAIGEDMYFGDVLGKHSDVRGELKREHVTVLSQDPNDIEAFRRVVGLTEGRWMGWNPLAQITFFCDRCDEEVVFKNRGTLVYVNDDTFWCATCVEELATT